MDPRLSVELAAVRRFEPERWNVRFEGKLIGYVVRKQVGSRGRAPWFYDGHVLTDGQDVSIEMGTDLDDRADKILGAYLDPMGCVHTRYGLHLGDVGGQR